MNTGSLTLMNIIKCSLFIIPLIISLRVEEQWRKNNIITELKLWNSTSSGNSEQNNKFAPAKQFFYVEHVCNSNRLEHLLFF